MVAQAMSPKLAQAASFVSRGQSMRTFLRSKGPRDSVVALWAHGHVHDTIDTARPGDTRIVCNTPGPSFTNVAFRDEWIIEL